MTRSGAIAHNALGSPGTDCILGYSALKKQVVAATLSMEPLRGDGKVVGASGEVRPCLRHGASAWSGNFVPPPHPSYDGIATRCQAPWTSF
jgi:hypothetical protein